MAESTPTPLQTYNGSCHCGGFKFTVKLPAVKQVTACNCSICSKNGYLWAFPKDDLVVEKGDGTLKEYQFADKTMSHKFCPTCGTSVLGQRDMQGPSFGVNVRALEGVDLEKLDLVPYDGASVPPAYVSPTDSGPSKVDDKTSKYYASCHCGKVTYSFESSPLDELTMTECNCSICSLNGYLWLYPPKTAVDIHGAEHLSCYRFGTQLAGHSFCSTCGVSMLNRLDPPGGNATVQPVNLRALNGVKLDGVKIQKANGRAIDTSELETEEGRQRARARAAKSFEDPHK